MTHSNKEKMTKIHFFIFYLIITFLSPLYHYHEYGSLPFTNGHEHEFAIAELPTERHSHENPIDTIDPISISYNEQNTAGHIHFKVDYHRANRHDNRGRAIKQKIELALTNSIRILTFSGISYIIDTLLLTYDELSPKGLKARSPPII